MTIGDKIRYHRKELGLTQTELGEKLGVKTNAVSKWECGRVEDIPTSKIKALSSLFGVPTSYLIDDEEVHSLPDNIIPMPKMYKVPLIGTIACGTPILAVENIEEEIDIPEHINADFALRCKGDSMIGADIIDGDIVYIKETPEVLDGQIAAVLVEDEATLKRVYYDREANEVQLVAENPKVRPMVYRGETLNHIRILGRAVGLTRLLV